MKQQNGFTLVELAIALMVIGLLIGGVLKGQELIENARIVSFMRDLKSYDSAAMIFRNTYGALPGDIKRPNRIPDCTSAACLLIGNGDGLIRTHEEANFFPHLFKAGMIGKHLPGLTSASDMNGLNIASVFAQAEFIIPETALGYHVYISNPTSSWSVSPDWKNAYTSPAFTVAEGDDVSLPTRMFIGIDSKFDDGKPASGDIWLSEISSCPASSVSGVFEYDTTVADIRGCQIMINVGF